MKKYAVSMVIFLAVLLMVWVVFGQEVAGSEKPEQARETVRKRRQDMSEQEREELRARIRERIGERVAGVWSQEQTKALKEIEKQVAKLKELVEGMEGATRGEIREMPPEERAKLRDRWTKVREERQKALEIIEQQVLKLKGQRQQRLGQEQTISELREIQQLAVKEKAGETVKRIEGLIERYQRSGGTLRKPEAGQRPVALQKLLRSEGLRMVRKAPEFTLNSFDGKTVNLSDYKGKIVVLEWFNLECPYVKYHYDTVSTMVNLANKYKDRNVIWLAINSTSHTTPGANKEFAQKHKLPYPILDDRSGKVGRAYGARTTPHMFIIDTNGNIVYEGAIDNSPMGKEKEGVVNYVDKALEELTSGKSVTTPKNDPYGCSVKYGN